MKNDNNIISNSKYDFKGEYYNSLYPNLHKYPATMLPQIGLKLLKEFKAKKTNLLDPYCGSGSSFSSGLEYGIKKFVGFDLNPLAILISKAKLNYIESDILNMEKDKLKNRISKKTYNKNYEMLKSKIINNIKNIDFDKQDIKEPNDIIDSEIDINVEEKKQNIKNIESDRKLKKNTQEFIKRILSLCVEFTVFIIALNAILKFLTDKELYSEWFLSVLIGSQLIILPFF